MTANERRASGALASIYALRMLGLFLVLPVFTLAAADYRGGDDARLIGLAMGIYGLTQAALQWPMGLASDRFGRKRVIVFGMLVFATGSVMAALADSVWGLVIGRAFQGAGAVSAAVTALLADHTREQVRTKAMALVGISIGATFSLALVLGPWLGARIGLAGLFWLIAVLALLGIAVLTWLVPQAPATHEDGPDHAVPSAASQALQRPPVAGTAGALWRLQAGVFILHAMQMAMWSAVPLLLVEAGLAATAHWQLYLPTIAASVVCFGAVFSLERRGRVQWALLLGVALLVVSQLALAAVSHAGISAGLSTLVMLGVLLFLFFCGFNALEALQPSLVSRLARTQSRGSAMGAYSTLQSLGLFTGGFAGGLLMTQWGAAGVFAVNGLLGAVWLGLLLSQRRWATPSAQQG
ncbi:membrane protein [Lampropedia cohaerens]|uniref:Membrane protein n=1 Tax=Lampropedia cohaerens TaxID=1610491 RepID=A0A0U1Q1Z1_9BURK|nr:MFS transporter [Lampropedia cohaerens]KKW68766.1 membrane protein [Lampropedia cohaerens]